MKTLIKTLAVLTAGVGAVAVVKRVRKINLEISNLKEFDRFLQRVSENRKNDSTSNVVLDAKNISEQALKNATEALEKANSYSR